MNMDVDCGDDSYYFSTEDWSAGCRHHNSYSVTLSLISHKVFMSESVIAPVLCTLCTGTWN